MARSAFRILHRHLNSLWRNSRSDTWNKKKTKKNSDKTQTDTWGRSTWRWSTRAPLTSVKKFYWCLKQFPDRSTLARADVSVRRERNSCKGGSCSESSACPRVPLVCSTGLSHEPRFVQSSAAIGWVLGLTALIFFFFFFFLNWWLIGQNTHRVLSVPVCDGPVQQAVRSARRYRLSSSVTVENKKKVNLLLAPVLFTPLCHRLRLTKAVYITSVLHCGKLH